MADTSRNIWGGGGDEIFNMYAFGVHMRILFKICEFFKYSALYTKFYCNVTITLYAYMPVCFLVPLAPKQRKL